MHNTVLMSNVIYLSISVNFTRDWVAASRWSVRLVAWVYRKRFPPDCQHRHQPPRRPPLVAAVAAAASAPSARPDSSVPCWSRTPAIRTFADVYNKLIVYWRNQVNSTHFNPLMYNVSRVWCILRQRCAQTTLFIALKNTEKLRCPTVNSEVNNEVKPHRADLQKKI